MADTKISALPAATVAAAANELAINEAGTSKKLTMDLLREFILKRAAGTSTAAGEFMTWLVLSANSSDITGTGLVTVMTITGVGVGRWYFRCGLVFQTTATTTGIGTAVNHTGTTTQWTTINYWVDTIATATTGGMRNSGTGAGTGGVAAGNTMGSHASIAKNTLIGAVNIDVQTANSDHMIIIEGSFVVSVTGSLEIKLQAELASLVVRAMQSSYLELQKLS